LEGKRAKVKYQKKFFGSKKPLGYIKEEDGSLKLATVDKTKELQEIIGLEAVNYIFLAYLSNQPISQIAKNLKYRFGLTRSGKEWDKNSVAYILRNDIYAGLLTGKIKGEEYIVHSDKVEPLLSQTAHQFVKTKINNETKGRKPNKRLLPPLTMCVHCLKSIVQNGSELSCPNCLETIDADFVNSSIEKNLTSYLFGQYSNENVDRYLSAKKSNLFLHINRLQEKIKDLKGTQKLIEAMFDDDPQELKLLLSHNFRDIWRTEREINETVQFLEFLYGENQISLEVVLDSRSGNELYIHLPYLILIDLIDLKIYLKFHPCIFERETSYERIP
jgi:hypothetical protein